MMLAYQPVRTLATLNMGIFQGISVAVHFASLTQIKLILIHKNLKVNNGNIEFKK